MDWFNFVTIASLSSAYWLVALLNCVFFIKETSSVNASGKCIFALRKVFNLPFKFSMRLFVLLPKVGKDCLK